jgi:glutathione S-transferase
MGGNLKTPDYAALNHTHAHLDGRELVACDRLTIADFQLAWMAVDWRESEMLFEAFRNIVRWLDGLARIPAWADPWAGTHSTD